MAEYPILKFPTPTRSERARRPGGGGRRGDITLPSPNSQSERLMPRFARLQSAMEIRRMELQDNPLGIQPEKTLVLETVGTIDNFARAVGNIDGLEWLGESVIEGVAPNYGFKDESNPERQMGGQLFLMMSDQQALGQMRSLFERWRESPDESFPHGLAKLKDAFANLYDIRPWGPEDRIRETGLADDWRARLAGDATMVPFEAELWFRNAYAIRQRVEAHFLESIRSSGGVAVQRLVIQEIAYHAVLGEIPADRIRDLIDRPETRQEIPLFQNEEVMYVRPVGQCAVPIPEDDVDALEDEDANAASKNIPNGNPIAALFDGMPFTGHQKLNGRLVIDDPDGYEDAYQTSRRSHGTAMSSLICHGDLGEAGEPINRKLYVRPIMKPQPASRVGREAIPDDVIATDLIRRSVRRMFEPENGEPPAAPSVRVVNLSIGNLAQPFVREMSTLARLLDWLSYRYNILFIVSAGNHTQNIEIAWSNIANLPPSDLQDTIIEAVADDTRNRRLLSPAETMNGLTVGASHSDASQVQIPLQLPPNTIDPFIQPGLPSIFSAHGPGYRRAIKPDIILSGGKQILQEDISTSFTKLVVSSRPPGQLVAAPGTSASGRLNQRHTRGTSNAAALASRAAHFLHGVIESMREDSSEDLPEEYDAVLIKTLLVHGANWDDIYSPYHSALRNSDNGRTFKDYVGRFMGYGTAEISRAMVCTDQRVTLLGVGALSDGKADEFTLPLPPSLSSTTHKRRLTVTMAWMTPINTRNQKYRVAHLWFNPNEQKSEIVKDRKNADYRAVQRGTVQHEILEGHQAALFQDGDNLVIKVNCRAEAGKITEPIRYGLAATLEIAETIDLPIYQEVRDRLAVRVRPRV